MNEKRPFNVDDAYAISTPEDSVHLYGQWAETYDEDFVGPSGYVAYLRVSEQLVRRRADIDGPVLDVGCGTGVVGVALKEGGIEEIDGIDISAPMLAVSRQKTTVDGSAVYRRLIAADLTEKLALADDQYAGLVSAGTFTHGHLGPESLDELWRVAAPGAWCAIGVRTTHYEAAGFGDKLAADAARGIIGQPELVEVGMYAGDTNNPDHADDKAYIVVCQVTK